MYFTTTTAPVQQRPKIILALLFSNSHEQGYGQESLCVAQRGLFRNGSSEFAPHFRLVVADRNEKRETYGDNRRKAGEKFPKRRREEKFHFLSVYHRGGVVLLIVLI